MPTNNFWPPKYLLLGVEVSATTYTDVTNQVIAATRQKRGGVVTALPVHGVVTANSDADLRAKINTFEIVAPDGQPVRWALNLLYGVNLKDRVYGPELMLRLCHRAAAEEIGVYLYGSYPQVVKELSANLRSWFAGLKIVGAESPPFRPLTEREDQEVIDRIHSSGAGLVFLGLGCPQQDRFAFDHRWRLTAFQICVGAAFDFHSGNKQMAPIWMQRYGLEWLFRLVQEPGRLWRRYLFTNTIFFLKFIKQVISQKVLGRGSNQN